MSPSGIKIPRLQAKGRFDEVAGRDDVSDVSAAHEREVSSDAHQEW